ncbi:MAG: hypothetical protein JWO09_975 [Bacteroidetes bacterium]|nr:hypothetical protein [Bacteroidota bacterium]
MKQFILFLILTSIINSNNHITKAVFRDGFCFSILSILFFCRKKEAKKPTTKANHPPFLHTSLRLYAEKRAVRTFRGRPRARRECLAGIACR